MPMDDNMEVLPCGCRMYTVDDTFVFEPHDMKCEFYQYVLDQAKKQDKPMTHLEM